MKRTILPNRMLPAIVCSLLFLLAGTIHDGWVWGQVPGKAAFLASPTTAQFGTLPVLPDCMQLSVQRGDPNTGPSIVLLKVSAGCAVPWHWHSFTEELMMVSGQARLQMKGQEPVVLEAGGYAFLPARHIHRFTSVGACVFYLAIEGPFDINYVDEAGNVIPIEQALPGKAPKTPTGSKN